MQIYFYSMVRMLRKWLTVKCVTGNCLNERLKGGVKLKADKENIDNG